MAILMVVLSCLNRVNAWSSASGGNNGPAASAFLRDFRPSDRHVYDTPVNPTPRSEAPNLVAQQMLKNPSVSQAKKRSVSLSVLAPCDTLPSFPTAHGLLSPETVMRLDRHYSESSSPSQLATFLQTYKQHGPLSCIPFLSDPDVLPHLTLALRHLEA
jgi:hypothetical protein